MKLLTAILLTLFSIHAMAADSLSYSGRLVNANGSPVTGPVNLKFDFAYTNATASILCSEQIAAVALTNGVFHVKLDPDCTPSTFLNVLTSVPAGEAVAIRVTDETHTKAYSFQALHSMPASIMSSMAKQLTQMGATPGQILTWDGTKWAPSNESGTGNGTVTNIATGTGLTGGPITVTGTISIANGGVDTLQLANSAVTDAKIAGGITRSKLINGTANAVIVNSAAGVMSEVAQLPLAQGGTGSNTAAGARTNLGLGTAAVADVGFGAGSVMAGDSVPICLANQKLQMNAGPIYWSCALDNDSLDNTKLPLDGSVAMTGTLDMDSHKIIDVTSPTDPGDAANKAYVDAQVGSLTSTQWSNNGSKIYYNADNVGIGTNNPTQKLSVDGNINIPNGGAGNDRSINIAVNGGAEKSFVRFDQTAAPGAGYYWDIGSFSAGNIYDFGFSFGTNRRMTILSSGNVGIATSTPGEKLEVAGNIALTGKARFQSDNANYVDLQAPNGLAGTLIFKLPGTAGASGNALVTDGSGNLSWAAVATGASAVGGDLTGTITNADIAAGVITNAEVAAGAAIAQSKIANLTTDLAAKEPTITAGTSAQYWRGDKTWQTLNTTAVPEGTSLYFTEPRVLGTDLAGYSAGSGAITSADTVLTAIEKLDGNINALSAAATTDLVNVTGDTMTGALILNADPAVALGAATKQYVDSKVSATSYWTKTVNDLTYTTGNVGIGIASPASLLHVRSDVAGTSEIRSDNLSTDPAATAGFGFNSDVGGGALLMRSSTFAGQTQYGRASGMAMYTSTTASGGITIAARHASGNIHFHTGGANEKMRLDSSGNLGIGTASPTQLLHINSASSGATALIQTGSNGSVAQTRFTGATAGGTARSWGTGLNIVDGTGAFDIYDYTAGASRLNIDTTGNVSLTGSLKLKSDTANYVVLRAPASLATTQTLTWPGTAGSSGNALTTDGAGNLSWSAVATTASSVGGDLTGTIANAQIAAGAIVDADISATAAIAQSKISGLTTSLSGKEPTITAGTTAQYWRGDKSWQTLNTTAVPEGTNLYFLDSRVRAALMSGYAVGSALPLAATDTLIEAIGKLEAQIIANDTAFDNSGVWSKNASTVYYSAGSVGVGTNNPLFKFHLADGTMFSSHAGTNTGVYLGAHSSGYGIIQATNATNSATKNLVLQQYGGYAGVGTSAPTTTLEVSGSEISSIKSVSSSNDSRVRIISTAAVSTSNSASIDLAVNSSTQERTAALITAQFTDTTDATRTSRLDLKPYINGGSVTTMSLWGPNVGIGTTNPLEKLVVGDHAIVAHDGGSKVLGFNTEYDATILWNAKTGGAYWGVLDFSPSSGNFVIASSNANGSTAANAKMIVTNAGTVGIGTTSPAAKLDVVVNSTNATTAEKGFKSYVTYTPSAAGVVDLWSQDHIIEYNSTFSGNRIIGSHVRALHSSSGNLTAMIGQVGASDNSGTATIGSAVGLYGRTNNLSTGTMTDAKAFYAVVGNPGGGTVTTGYGVYIDNISATNKYSLYAADTTAKSYFGGTIGIGTTAPVTKLQIGTPFANVASGWSSNRTYGVMIGDDSDNVYFGLDNKGSNEKYGTITWGDDGTEPFLFQTNDANGVVTERMRISGTGNLGIGTTNPNKPLTIVGGANTGIRVEGSSGNTHLDFTVGGVVKTNFYWDMANNFAVLNGSGSDLIMNGGSGNVGIGTTAPGYKLHVIGDINASGSVRAAGVALTSDKRFKKDVKPIANALDKILSLNGVGYNWKVAEYPERNFVERHQIGVIAQEVEKVFPELVDTDKNGYKSVNYPALVAPLIESTKALNAKNIEQSREIASLKEENAEMKARLERLEKAILKGR